MVGGKISTFLKTVPILYVPVNPITTLDEKGFNYSLVFFRDSVGGLDARLQVYMATPDYKKANPTFNVNNFSGYFFQIHLNGKVDKVFAIENGKFAAKVSFAANSRFNPNQATTRCFCCECWHNAGSGVVHNVRCFLCALGEAIGNTVSAVVTNISDSNNNNSDSGTSGDPNSNPWSLGYGNPNGGNIPDLGGSNSGGNTGNLGGGSPVVINGDGSLGGEIDNTIFENIMQSRYLGSGFSLLQYESLHTNPFFSQINTFLENTATNGVFSLSSVQIIAGFNNIYNSNTGFRTALNNRSGYTPIIDIFARYIGVGFTNDEFAKIFSDQPLFTQVDAFLNKHIGEQSAEEHAKDMSKRALIDPDLREAIISWNPFLIDICKDLAYDLLWELFKKHAPGLKDKALIESMIKNLKNSDYLDLTHDILNIAKRYVPWAKFVDIAWDGYEYGKKFEKAYTAFTKIQKLGDNIAGKFFTLIKSNYGSILDKIHWKDKNWGAIMPDVDPHDFWGKIGQYFPGGTYSIGHNPQNPLEQTWKLTNPDIVFKFYPGSNTTTASGLPNCYTLDVTVSSSTFKIRFCQ